MLKKQFLKSSHLESIELFYKRENQSEGCYHLLSSILSFTGFFPFNFYHQNLK